MNTFHLVKLLKEGFASVAGEDMLVQIDELHKMLAGAMGKYAADAMTKELFEQLDQNNDQNISLQEVNEWYDKRCKQTSRLLQVATFKPLGTDSFTTRSGESLDLLSLLCPSDEIILIEK